MKKIRLNEALIILILLIIAAVSFFPRLETVPLHVDENHFIWFSRIFKSIFIDHNRIKTIRASYFVPNMTSILTGFAIYYTCPQNDIDQISHDRWWIETAEKPTPPPKTILYSARAICAVFAAFACLLVYFIMRISFNIKSGVFACLLLSFNPLMRDFGSRAMSEAPNLFFSLAAVLSILLFYQEYRNKKFKKAFILALCAGVYIGLACATKFSGILGANFFLLFSLLLIASEMFNRKAEGKGRRITMILLSLAAAYVLAFVVFICFHPALYERPIAYTIKMVKSAHSMSLYSRKVFYMDVLGTVPKKFTVLFKRTLFPNNYAVLGNITKMAFDLCLFILGAFMLARNEIKVFGGTRQFSPGIIVILWSIVTFLGVGFWIPLDWPRYYITVVCSIAMILGYTLDRLLTRSSRWLKDAVITHISFR